MRLAGKVPPGHVPNYLYVRRKMRIKAIFIVAVVLFFAYLVSFGPYLYIINVVNVKYPHHEEDSRWWDTIGLIFIPHQYISRYSEWYFGYTMWFAQKGGNPGRWTYKDQCKEYK